MQYILTGVTHSMEFRVFAFDCVTDHWVRTAYRVRADLALARKHGIPIQELPLLCRAVLERRSEDDDRRAFTFTEDDMSLHRSLVRAALEAGKKKTPRGRSAAATSDSSSSVRPPDVRSTPPGAAFVPGNMSRWAFSNGQ
jgi:hypothetical protein